MTTRFKFSIDLNQNLLHIIKDERSTKNITVQTMKSADSTNQNNSVENKE